MTMYDFESSLRARLRWYNDAIALKTGERKWVNGFNFPAGDVEVWRGAAMELKNTLDMVGNLHYMNKQISELGKKYGEHMVRMAIDHVIGVGANNLKDVDADAVCKKILKETPENYIMTPEFRAELMRCAIELARNPIGDILKYIQTNMEYDGVTVHPGVILEFKQNATCKHIMSCVVPADTNDCTLDDVVKAVEGKAEAYISEKGSAYGFSYCQAIEEAFKAAKIRLRDIPVDKTYYL